MIDYCVAHKIPVQASAKKPFSMDRNLLHISYEAGILEDCGSIRPTRRIKSFHDALRFPRRRAQQTEFVTLDFRKGNCVAVNGKKLSLGVMKALNKFGGKHGVGRVDMVENRQWVVLKSRGVYDARRRDPAFCTSADGKPYDDRKVMTSATRSSRNMPGARL